MQTRDFLRKAEFGAKLNDYQLIKNDETFKPGRGKPIYVKGKLRKNYLQSNAILSYDNEKFIVYISHDPAEVPAFSLR